MTSAGWAAAGTMSVLTMRRFVLAALLPACIPTVDDPAGSTSEISTSGLAATGGSTGMASSESGSSSSDTGQPVEVCLQVEQYTAAGDGDLYDICSLACSTGCPVDPLHVAAKCVLMAPYIGESVMLCMSVCESDDWCAKDEICVDFAEGRFCVPAASKA